MTATRNWNRVGKQSGGHGRRDDWRAKAVEMSALGWGIKRIAKAIGCSAKVVLNARKEAGMPTWIGPRGGRQPEERALSAMREQLKEESELVRRLEKSWLDHPECVAWSNLPYWWKNVERNRRISNNNAKRYYQANKHNGAFRARKSAQLRVWKVCKDAGSSKSARSMELIGCTDQELREHLESKFKRGMGWHNYGEWEVDHIIPCASFDLTKPEHQRLCFHYTNLQPLWQRDNRSKSDKVPANAQPSLPI